MTREPTTMREAKRIERAAGPTWLERAQLATFVLAIAMLASLSLACDGGDNGGGGTSTTPCLRYESSGVPGAITVTTTDGAPDDDECNFLFVDLMVHDVQDLYAANFVVTYPVNVVGFSAAFGAESFLGSDNTAVDVEARITNSGEVTIGITRLAAPTGIDIPNDGVGKILIRLAFIRAASSGSGDIEFTTSELIDSGDLQTGPQPIPDSVWTGGTIGIVQI
jgi:hypothetical protein